MQSRPSFAIKLHRLSNFLALPGFTSAVFQDGKVIFRQTEGYADIVKKEPMRDDSIIGIASVTKTFTGTIRRQLEQEGKISFQDFLLNIRLTPHIRRTRLEIQTSEYKTL